MTTIVKYKELIPEENWNVCAKLSRSPGSWIIYILFLVKIESYKLIANFLYSKSFYLWHFRLWCKKLRLMNKPQKFLFEKKLKKKPKKCFTFWQRNLWSWEVETSFIIQVFVGLEFGGQWIKFHFLLKFIKKLLNL